MTLTSSSTDAQVEAAYDDNADWREVSDVTKARAFAQACRMLIRRYPSSAGENSVSISRNTALLERQLAEAQAWLDANDSDRSDGSVSYGDFREART